MWWTWLATAFAACPEVAAQPDSVARAVDDAFRAYAAQDSAAYVEAWLRGEVAVACAPVALEPDVVGRLLALRAVHADVMGQPDAAGRAWAAARRVGGDAVLPEGLPVDPSRFPVPAEDWPQPLTLPEAAGFTWRVDGRDVPVLYPGRPSLVQRLNTDGVWWSGVVEEVSAIPMPPASSDPETEPGLLSARGYSFVRVPAGTFRQGSPLRERGRDSDEAQREVTLTRDVWIGATEVPDHLWRAARGEPSLVRDRTPARGAPFVEVVAFCNRLSELEGLAPAYRIDGDNIVVDLDAPGYRLPTEAEWERAARLDGSSLTSGGDLDAFAWHRKNSGVRPHDVGGKRPDASGLYDLTGNVREWVFDRYDLWSTAPATDPTGSERGGERVVRGGSYADERPNLRIADREHYPGAVTDPTIGFRLARTAR
jgi:sulfatase modifying factor 1